MSEIFLTVPFKIFEDNSMMKIIPKGIILALFLLALFFQDLNSIEAIPFIMIRRINKHNYCRTFTLYVLMDFSF